LTRLWRLTFRHIDPPFGDLDLIKKGFALMSKTFKAMAGKSIGMHQLKQIVDLLIKNYSIRSIVRMSGVSRISVRK